MLYVETAIVDLLFFWAFSKLYLPYAAFGPLYAMLSIIALWISYRLDSSIQFLASAFFVQEIAQTS